MHSPVRFVAGLLFLSGMCALIYQTVWLREFRLVFGGSTTASAAVLAIFMGGLGFGNLLLGPIGDRQAKPMKFYALLELGIGLFCAATPFLIDLVRTLYASLGGQDGLGVAGATFVRLLLATLVLAVPTLLMGGTLPIAAKSVTIANDQQRLGLGLVYGLNTLGAVLGVVLSTFVLLPNLGGRTTLWLACAVNLVVAFIAWRAPQIESVSTSLAAAPVERTEKKGKKPKRAPEPVAAPLVDFGPTAAWLVYATSGLVGFAFFLLELVWYRMLSPLLGGSSYTFGLILAVALAGIGIGGAIYPLVFRKRSPQPYDLASTLALQAAFVAIPIAIGDNLAVACAMAYDQNRSGFGGAILIWTVVTTVVVFLPALMSGIQFPILIGLLGRGEEHVSKQVGWAFAWNTLGCIAGSLLGGFGLMPLLTAPGLWRMVVVAMAIMATYWLVVEARRHGKWLTKPVTLVLAVFAVIMAAMPGPTAVWRHAGVAVPGIGFESMTPNQKRQWLHTARSSIVWEADGVESGVGINNLNSLAFVVNGKTDGNSWFDRETQIMLGIAGAIRHPSPKDVFVVGLGTGETAGWLAKCDEVERVDCVELEPAVIKMAEMCKLANHNVLQNPKVRCIINDAREALTTNRETYDLVVSEPSNPYRVGISNLFTREFYQSARSRLKPGGCFGQWLQAYAVDRRTIAIVFETLRSVFPNVEVWQTGPGDMLLLASEEPLPCQVDSLRKRIATEPYRSALHVSVRDETLEAFLSDYIGGTKFVDAYIAANGKHEINSDDHNLLEFAFARGYGTGKTEIEVQQLRDMAAEVGDARIHATSGEIDWTAAHEALFMNRLLWNLPIEDLRGLDAEQETRFQAWGAHRRGKSQDALDLWAKQSQKPRTAVELGNLATCLVDIKDSAAAAMIDQLRVIEPAEADVLMARVALQNNDVESAAEHAIAAITYLRTNPWPIQVERVFDLLIDIVDRKPELAAKLHDVLSEPMAICTRENRRIQLLYYIASQMGPEYFAAALAPYEPNVIWSEPVLTRRAEVYEKLDHPRAAQARRDLNTFLNNE